MVQLVQPNCSKLDLDSVLYSSGTMTTVFSSPSHTMIHQRVTVVVMYRAIQPMLTLLVIARVSFEEEGGHNVGSKCHVHVFIQFMSIFNDKPFHSM